MITIPKPTQCTLWKENPTPEQLLQAFEQIKEIADVSGFFRAIVRCAECGQLFVSQLVEHEDDSMFRTYIPVSSETDADRLGESMIWDFETYRPQLRYDWSGDKRMVFWLRE